MIAKKSAYRWSLLAGICLLLLSLSGSFLEPVKVCGPLPANYQPIIAFELARSVEDLQTIFGASGGECRAKIAERMDLTNRIDSIVYIPLYGAFVILYLLGARSRNPRIGNLAVAIAAIACVGDYFENLCLFQLSASPDVASASLTGLAWATGVKWLGLGIAGAIGGYLADIRNAALGFAVRVAGTIGLVGAIAAMISPARFGPYLSLAIALGWLAFLLIDAREAFRRTWAQA
jgi:hypothetical protein